MLKFINADVSFTKRLAQQKRRASIQAYFLDCGFSYYLLFSLLSLWLYFSSDSLALTNSQFVMMIPAAFVLGTLTFAFTNSLGRVLVFRNNKMLKGLEYGSYDWRHEFSGWYTFGMVILTLILGYVLTEMDPVLLLSAEGIGGAKRIFSALLSPNLNILNMVLNAMIVTIFIAFTATATSIPIAFALSFMASRNLMNFSLASQFTYAALRFIFNFTRSVEPLIWAIIFSVWVGIGPFAGMIALMLHSIASLSKLYSEAIESVDRGPMEAIEATGANRIQVIWYSVVPQVVLPFLSFTIYRWDINIRMATVIGLVGGGGVGTLLMQYQGLARWNEVGTIIIVIAIVVWFMDFVSAKLREAIY